MVCCCYPDATRLELSGRFVGAPCPPAIIVVSVLLAVNWICFLGTIPKGERISF